VLGAKIREDQELAHKEEVKVRIFLMFAGEAKSLRP